MRKDKRMTSENSEEIKEVTDFVASALLMNPCLEEDRPKGSEEGEGMAEVTWENRRKGEYRGRRYYSPYWAQKVCYSIKY